MCVAPPLHARGVGCAGFVCVRWGIVRLCAPRHCRRDRLPWVMRSSEGGYVFFFSFSFFPFSFEARDLWVLDLDINRLR